VQKAVAESGLPYQIVGDGSPYDTPEVQAIIALMKSAVTGDDPRLEGFSASQARTLRELIGTSQAQPSAFAERVIATLGFEPTRDLAQLVSVLVRFDSLAEAVEYFNEIAERGFYDAQADAITLLTIHASKGLEFPRVFLIGAEDGILPNKQADAEEEKRLFYVAITRAKHRLEVLHAKNRGGQPAAVSQFVADLPAAALERMTDPDMDAQIRRIAKRQAKRSQQSLF
jgi:superfamily I DNA/RNA helicase